MTADVSVHLDRATYEALRTQAEEDGVTVEDLVARLVAELRTTGAPTGGATSDDLT